MTNTYFYTLTFYSADNDTVNDNDYDIKQLDGMLAQKGDAEKRILAKMNATKAYSSVRWASLQTQIADEQLEQSDSHRTYAFSQS